MVLTISGLHFHQCHVGNPYPKPAAHSIQGGLKPRRFNYIGHICMCMYIIIMHDPVYYINKERNIFLYIFTTFYITIYIHIYLHIEKYCVYIYILCAWYICVDVHIAGYCTCAHRPGTKTTSHMCLRKLNRNLKSQELWYDVVQWSLIPARLLYTIPISEPEV